MSDANVIIEAQTEKGNSTLKAHWPHNTPIRCVSDDMALWERDYGERPDVTALGTSTCRCLQKDKLRAARPGCGARSNFSCHNIQRLLFILGNWLWGAQ